MCHVKECTELEPRMGTCLDGDAAFWEPSSPKNLGDGVPSSSREHWQGTQDVRGHSPTRGGPRPHCRRAAHRPGVTWGWLARAAVQGHTQPSLPWPGKCSLNHTVLTQGRQSPILQCQSCKALFFFFFVTNHFLTSSELGNWPPILIRSLTRYNKA